MSDWSPEHMKNLLRPLEDTDPRETVWDECCQAFAWAMKEEPNLAPVSWLAYVHDNNPYRSDHTDNTTDRTHKTEP